MEENWDQVMLFACNIENKYQIFPGDGLPENICVLCEKMINDFSEFKEKCVKVNEKLHLYKDTSQNYNDIIPIVKGDVFNDASQINDKTNQNIKIEFNHDNLFNNDSEEFYIKPAIIEKTLPNKKNYKTNILQCEICGQTYQKNYLMKLHMLKHTSKKPYSCQICNQTFTRKDSQIVHSRIHSNVRPFTCDTCGKSSRKKQDLIRHMRIHSDKKDFKCFLCNNRFRRAQDVKAHMRSHTGDKPFKCDKCIKSYSSHSALQKHRGTLSCKMKQ